jgi:hypothetical protein
MTGEPVSVRCILLGSQVSFSGAPSLLPADSGAMVNGYAAMFAELEADTVDTIGFARNELLGGGLGGLAVGIDRNCCMSCQSGAWIHECGACVWVRIGRERRRDQVRCELSIRPHLIRNTYAVGLPAGLVVGTARAHHLAAARRYVYCGSDAVCCQGRI